MKSAKTTPATATTNPSQGSHVTSLKVTQYGDGGNAIGGNVSGDVGGAHTYNTVLNNCTLNNCTLNNCTLNLHAHFYDAKVVTDGAQYCKNCGHKI